MKKLGSGLQFKVYDLGDGKVFKKLKGDFEMYLINLWWEPHLLFAPWILKRKIEKAKKDRGDAIKYFSSKKFDKSLLANLVINSKGIFQDKVIPISKVFDEKHIDGKELIDLYCILIKNMWGQGFAEKVYKFVENYGLDSKGRVVLMDFAEMRFKRELIEEDIIIQRWRKVFSDKMAIKGDLRDYYNKSLMNLLTIKNLNLYWKNDKVK